MNKLNISLSELLNMLKIAESHIKKEKAPLLVNRISKKKASMRDSKKRLNPKSSMIKRKKEKKVSRPSIYFHYGKEGHWKRNCKSFLATVKLDANVASRGVIEN
ncbi:uncharacterized protein [Elaeis guineensis]|uniref:uncharacterized protein n=1 Tax=Elaeis guineensis var. tenera TaxID=51953 RepID=UPI003C6D96E8